MKLSHISMVGWHMFDIEDIEIDGDIGILGENRSGKSTILDLLQIILTGASPTYYRLNSTAGDNGGAKSKSKRSVHGYCLGALGEGVFRRNSGLTYVTMGFKDPAGVRPPVTIGLAMEASRTETVEVILGRFVAIGKVLTTEDFLEQRDGETFPMPWDDFRAKVVEDLGADNFINHRDKALDYVREYMRRLIPSLPSVEKSAAGMLKAIVNAMTLPTGLSATDFVRNFIIADNPIRIADLRNSIETYRSVDRAIAEMKERLGALKIIRDHVQEFSQAVNAEAMEAWILKRGRWLAALSRNRELKRGIAAANQRLGEREDEIADLRTRIEEIDLVISNTRGLIATKRAGSGLDAKQKLVTALSARIGEIQASIQKRLEQVLRLTTLTEMQGLPFDLRAVLRNVVIAANQVRGGAGPAPLLAAEVVLMSSADVLLPMVEVENAAVNDLLAASRRRFDELKLLLGDDHANRSPDSHLDVPTRDLMRALRQANMAPRALCDIVEISDPAWTSAVEGLLGRDREAVFVDRADVPKATAIYKANRRDFKGASLVSLNKIRDGGETPRAGFLPSVIATEDRDAMLFIIRRHGTVRLAYDTAQFEMEGRALMQDGLYDDGLARTHRGLDPGAFKIGRAAQTSLLQRRRAEAQDLAASLGADMAKGRAIAAASAALSSLASDASTFAVLFDEARKALGDQEATQAEIDAIISRGDDGLSDKLKANLAVRDRANKDKEELDKALAEDRAIVKSNEVLLGALQNTPGSSMNLTIAKRLYAEHRKVHKIFMLGGRLEYRARYSKALGANDVSGDGARSRAHGDVFDAADSGLERAKARRSAANDAARRELREFFGKFGPSAQVGAESELIMEVKPWMDLNISDIENNALREREREAAEAAEKARSLFRSEFINEITSRIANMEWELRALNAGMAGHPFHHDRYSFHKTQDTTYGPILRVIEIAKTSEDALDMLFRDDIPADFEFADTVAEVTRLLEDPDIEFSAFEDYRKFYTFDLHTEDIVTGRKSRWEVRRETGSGAEQQVPLYVAIAASLASVYGHKQTTHSDGMALAMFDEAFTKLDGKNQRQMIDFFKALGLQVVIVAPPEKRAIVTGYIDTIVEVDRIEDAATTEVVYLKERVRREVDAINPDNMSDEEVKNLMAAE